jgi:hypothetical protein
MQRKKVMTTKLRIDEELRAFIPPLTTAETEALERSLVETGRAIEPLTVWHGTLLDGHHRYAICTRLGLPFDTIEIELADREAAKAWMFDRQIARRNLSRDQILALAALRGMPRPKCASGLVSWPTLVAMATSETERARVESVLAGSATVLMACGLHEKNRGGQRQQRRTKVDIAVETALALSQKDFEFFVLRIVEAREKRDA